MAPAVAPGNGGLFGTRLHDELVAWAMAQLTDDEWDELYDGLRPIMYGLVDAAFTRKGDRAQGARVIEQLISYVESWVLSMQLATDAQWQSQVEKTEGMRPEKGDESLDAAELRKLLKA